MQGKRGSRWGEYTRHSRGKPMARRNTLPLDEAISLEPMHTFQRIKDLVTNVKWNFDNKKKIPQFRPRKPDAPDGTWRIMQEDIERVQEFRKCIECFLCQDVCHVLRDHELHEEFIGPRLLVYTAALEMHPLATGNRLPELKDKYGMGYSDYH